ncbi:penicillin binding protein transpeptidase domain-containing protein [Sphingobacterium athyrii]|uniref:beta-lactamase n=2 Tax=Sphingobacterium athyrii TaxID=2152717 RepID=A0A363NSX4_9SPHI|nr:penicillin-binding transpeptidase domain-containing protein [Sphingobacterium athyrii]PUV23915.1 penicillin binding protein transpeptidase domain-containing protein [Sphingobacterium athyrii]
MKRFILSIFVFMPVLAYSQLQGTLGLTSPKIEDSIIVRSDFKRYFDACEVDGSIAIYDNARKSWILSDTLGTKQQDLPASTFKIINMLIALETGTIKDENDIVKWPGKTDTVKYGYRPSIYHDITVKEAFEVSAGWAFVELSKRIGKERYKSYLAKCHYGNLDLSQTDPDFWNYGKFAISPINQVIFLKELYDGILPFSKRNMDIVRRVMLTEQQKGYSIRSKTGWTRQDGINTGWWIGYLTTNDNVYFFATRLRQYRKNNKPSFGNCRKEITLSVLKDLAAYRQN